MSRGRIWTDKERRLLAKLNMRQRRARPDYVRKKDSDADREKARIRMSKRREEHAEKIRANNRACSKRRAFKSHERNLKWMHNNLDRPIWGPCISIEQISDEFHADRCTLINARRIVSAREDLRRYKYEH